MGINHTIIDIVSGVLMGGMIAIAWAGGVMPGLSQHLELSGEQV